MATPENGVPEVLEKIYNDTSNATVAWLQTLVKRSGETPHTELAAYLPPPMAVTLENLTILRAIATVVSGNLFHASLRTAGPTGVLDMLGSLVAVAKSVLASELASETPVDEVTLAMQEKSVSTVN